MNNFGANQEIRQLCTLLCSSWIVSHTGCHSLLTIHNRHHPARTHSRSFPFMIPQGQNSAASSDSPLGAGGRADLVVKDTAAVRFRHKVCEVAGVVARVYASTADCPQRLHTYSQPTPQSQFSTLTNAHQCRRNTAPVLRQNDALRAKFGTLTQ